MVLALINFPERTGSFEEIADFITERNLFPEREGNIPLSEQVMLRSTKSSGKYLHLFELVGPDIIRLRNLLLNKNQL